MVDALVTASYALMEGVFDELLAQGLPETLRLATFGDRLLDFLPQPVNSALQDYDRIAELTLQCAGRDEWKLPMRAAGGRRRQLARAQAARGLSCVPVPGRWRLESTYHIVR